MKLEWLQNFQKYWGHKQDPELETHCLEVLGDKVKRQEIADIEKTIDFDYLVEVLTIMKERQEMTKDPLTAWELVSFIRACSIEIEAERGEETMKKSKREFQSKF